MDDPQREILNWSTYGKGVRELAKTVADDGFVPDIILAIARGGLFAGGSLGYALSCKNLFVMNVEYYTGVDERRDVPVMLPPFLNLSELSGSKVLVADDVADTGHTLNLVLEVCSETGAEVRSAVLYEKAQSIVKCDYVWRRTEDWIEFPWSSEPPIVAPSDGSKPVLDA